MASIMVSDLSPLGADLFLDCENYLQELQQVELASVEGGISITASTLMFGGAVFGFFLGRVGAAIYNAIP